MINIRKEQKITVPNNYREYLKPSYVFIPIKEDKSYPKKAVQENDYIDDKKIPITGEIVATAVNGQKRYLIIKNKFNNDDNKINSVLQINDSEQIRDISADWSNKIKTDNWSKEIIESLLKKFREQKVLYIDTFDEDPYAFNNYYLLLQEKDKILLLLEYLLDNDYLQEIYLVIPATYEAVINAYKKIKSTKIKLIILNDYFALSYKDILSKNLRIKKEKIVSIEELLNIYDEVSGDICNYIYVTIKSEEQVYVLKVIKYTILKEILEYLQIDMSAINITFNNSMLWQPIDFKYVLNEETKLIIVNKKEELSQKQDNKKDYCFNCGLCYTSCPWHFNPLKKKKCFNCGLCNYVCPSKKMLKVGDNNG